MSKKDVIEEGQIIDPTPKQPGAASPKKYAGTGAGLTRYEQFVVRLNMATRASTRPGGRDMEGYVTSANIVSFFRATSGPEEMIEGLNRQVGWHLGGTPNEITWYFPEGTVKPGMSLACKCEWVNATPHAAQPNYRYDLQIIIPNQ